MRRVILLAGGVLALSLAGCTGDVEEAAPVPSVSAAPAPSVLHERWTMPEGTSLLSQVEEQEGGGIQVWSATLSVKGEAEGVIADVVEQAEDLGYTVRESDVAGTGTHRIEAERGSSTVTVDVVTAEGQSPYVRFLGVNE